MSQSALSCVLHICLDQEPQIGHIGMSDQDEGKKKSAKLAAPRAKLRMHVVGRYVEVTSKFWSR